MVGLLSFFILPSTPSDVRWLTQEEREYVDFDLMNLLNLTHEPSVITKRLVHDRPTTSPIDSFSIREIFNALTSPHVFFVFVCLFMNGVTLYGLALFLPTIVSELGFSATHTQLVSVGPFAAAFVCKLEPSTSYHSIG